MLTMLEKERKSLVENEASILKKLEELDNRISKSAEKRRVEPRS